MIHGSLPCLLVGAVSRFLSDKKTVLLLGRLVFNSKKVLAGKTVKEKEK